MNNIVGQLADLTTLRDRQSLDLALVGTLHDLLQPTEIRIARQVGPNGHEHWLTAAEIVRGVLQDHSAQAWAELDQLPLASAFPLRMQALAQQHPCLTDPAGSCTVFPLLGEHQAVAVLEVACSAPLPPEQLRLVDGVLRLYQNFQNLLDYGERDALTELLNRKTFDGAFLKATMSRDVAQLRVDQDKRRTEKSLPQNQPASFWLAMLDIDHFKRINDTYGHLIGDEVLVLLARLMRTSLRIHDQLYRFGGEEFVMLMRCPGNADAQVALQRLRSNVEHYRFPQVGSITVSIGFTQVRALDAPSNALERADKAIYYAKEHGRNQVCSFEALLAQGALTVAPDNMGDVELF